MTTVRALVVLLVMCVFTPALSCEPATADRAVGQPVPHICFADAGGATRCISDFRGQVVVLNLWATFCAPCLKELPLLDRLQAQLHGDGLTVVALAVDRRGAMTVQRMREKLGIVHLAFYLDAEAEALEALNARGIPLTLLIDRAGTVRSRYPGGIEVHEHELRDDINGVLSAAPPDETNCPGDTT